MTEKSREAKEPSQLKLVQDIERAFRDVEHPGPEHVAYDQSGHHLECLEVAEAFANRHWSELSIGDLRLHQSSLFFMTPEAFHFFLPAYLIAAVQHYDQADLIPTAIVRSLMPPESDVEQDLYERRLSLLNEPQRTAIRSVLVHLREEHSADFPPGDGENADDFSRLLRLWS